MAKCLVCGKVCGDLRGLAKSWRCAGILSHQTRTGIYPARDALRARFSNEAKSASREALLPDLMALPPGARVLDLYGGGVGSEWLLQVRPDIDLTVAEIVPALWSGLRYDAERLGFTPVYGDCASATGPFDFIWLDLCSEPFAAYEAVRSVVPLLTRPVPVRFGYNSLQERVADSRRPPVPSVLYVTVMNQNRGGHPELHREARDIAVRALLEDATETVFSARRLLSYPQAGGKGTADIWVVGPSYVEQLAAIREASAKRKWREDEDRKQRESGAARHREMVAEYWRRVLEADALARSGGAPRYYSDGTLGPMTHGEARCKCARNGYIEWEEQQADADRWNNYMFPRKAAA